MRALGVFIGVAAVAGLVLAATKSPGAEAMTGPQKTLAVKAGETWMVTIKAVGRAITQADEDQIRGMAPHFGTLQSLVRSQDGKMLVYVITYSKPTTLITNQLIALTTMPDVGFVISEAMPLPSGGPQLQESIPTPNTSDVIARAGDVYFLRVATLEEATPADETLLHTLFPGATEGFQKLTLPNGRVLYTFTLKVAEDKRWPLLMPIPTDQSGHGLMVMEALKRS